MVLSAGTASALHLIKTAKKNFSDYFEIFACDTNPDFLIPASKFADKFIQVLPFTSPDYYSQILNLISKNKIDILIPFFDADIKFFYGANPDLKKLNTLSTAPLQKVLGVYENKLLMNNFLAKNSFKVPQLFSKESLIPDKNYFVKPINGVGSKGAKVLSGKEILDMNTESYLLQEVCLPEEITIEIFSGKNNFKTVCRERLETKAGVCSKGKVFYDAEFHNLALKLAKAIKLPYMSNIQVMKNSNNEWVITDVNLRLAAGTGLCAAAGWDMCSAMLLELCENPPASPEFLPEITTPKYVVRTFEDIVMS